MEDIVSTELRNFTGICLAVCGFHLIFLQVQHRALRKYGIKEAAGKWFFKNTAAYHVSSEQMSS